MKKEKLFLSVVFTFAGIFLYSWSDIFKSGSFLQTGDIIFQTSQSAQCKAVQAATHSIYSHCGIIYSENGEVLVYEAIGPVRFTPFKEWISHGKDNKYIVRRLKNTAKDLNPETLSAMKKSAEKYKGKNYDIYFGWSDELIYCSELVWKIYKEGAGIEIGKLQKLKEFDLTSAEVKKIMKERYGKNIPFEEIVISPASIFASDLLETVEEN